MNQLKKQAIFSIGMSWIIVVGLIVTMAIESRLEDPWIRITNALWIVGMVALAFFMGRGIYILVKYLKEKNEKENT